MILPQPKSGNNAAIVTKLRINWRCKVVWFPGVQIWRAGLHNDESGGGQLRNRFEQIGSG